MERELDGNLAIRVLSMDLPGERLHVSMSSSFWCSGYKMQAKDFTQSCLSLVSSREGKEALNA